MRLNIFIRRPILASVISIIIALCGLVATFNLQVSQFPDISPPSISISATYPGADAETAARVVAAQIENQMNGVSNLTYMYTSTTSQGNISIKLIYDVGTNLNYAINEVLNRLQASMALLPSVVQRMGVTARKSSPDQLMSIAFYSDPYIDPAYVSNYLERTVENDLLLLPEVGMINVFGTGSYAIRIWLDPNKMQRYDVTVDDVQNAINDQNEEFTVGRSNSAPDSKADVLGINIYGQSMYSDPKDFANIIIRNKNNQTIRIKDFARVELGTDDYSTIAQVGFRESDGTFRNYPCNIMQVYLTPGANQLEAKNVILKRLAQDAKGFPTGLQYRIIVDNSKFVKASVVGVVDTLEIAFILVAIIIFLFLQNYRASLIAIISIPVSIIGTMACLYMLDFSLNTLSLFALILAIGIVVDDSIVIVENIERLREQYPDYSLRHIIELTLKEVFGAVIAIMLVLSVVFIPVMFLSGLSGIMYRQFAVTISCAVILSGISALTFTPAISSLILKKVHAKPKFLAWFDVYFEKLTNFYVKIANYLMHRTKLSLFIFALIVISTVVMFKSVKTGFVPNEDQGLIFSTLNLPTDTGLDKTASVTSKLAQKITDISAVDSMITIVGYDFLDNGSQKTYAASMFIALKDWKVRHYKGGDANSVIDKILSFQKLFDGAVIRAFNQPTIRGLSTTGGVEFYVEDRVVGDIHKLQDNADVLIKRLMTHKEVGLAYQTLDTNLNQVSMVPNIAMAKFYGVNLNALYNALQTVYSDNNVNYAYIMQDLVWVILQADAPFRDTIDSMRNVYIRGLYAGPDKTEGLIPLGSVVNVTYDRGPQVLQRFNGYMASKIVANPAPGYSFGDVMKVIEQEVGSLSKTYNHDWFGTSYQMTLSQKTSAVAFVFSFIMIYLVLAALFEMWRLPLVVIMGIPFALFGAALILLLSGLNNDLYFQISLIALLGLSAKNIILLVEFALQYYNQGHDVYESAIHSIRLRFRPIIMTSVTFIFGTLPLVFANEAGANAQHSVGLGIIGGILGSMFLATLLTPAFFVMIMKNYKKKSVDE